MPIECRFDPEQSLLICTVTGELTFDQLVDLQDKYFEKYTTKNLIVDISLASADHLDSRDIESIVQISDMRKNLRPAHSKTAIVATSPAAYGLGMTYAICSEFKELPWDLSVFKSMDEALSWIGPGDVLNP